MTKQDLIDKGYVQQPDGSWRRALDKPARIEKPALPAPKPKKRPAHKNGLMNQTERRFYALLKERHPTSRILFECITLQLAPTCRYTPDFLVGEPGRIPMLWDVKGAHTWEDSIIKLKWAATAYPMFRFGIARWKGGKWTEWEFTGQEERV